jgi:hypothetical protein
MKSAIAFVVIVGGIWVGILGPALAQDAEEGVDARALLEIRKREQAAQFDAQEQACSKTFAVTDCISSVSARRRVVVAALRKEENALNDAERRQHERERLQSQQQKAKERAEQAPSVDPNAESAEERLHRQQDQMANHAPQSVPKAPTAPKVQATIDAQTKQQNAVDYAARQKAANDRRAAREKKLKEQGKAPVDLPTPP